MADVWQRTTRVTCPVITGTFDITIPGMGTPKLALFYLSLAITDNTAANGANPCVGAADGTNQWATSSFYQHGAATTGDGSRGVTDKCVLMGTISGVVVGEAGFDSFITDGVRINFTDNVPSGYLLSVVFFGGADFLGEAGTINLGTATTAQTHTLAREPDAMILWSIGELFNDTGVSRAQSILGLVHNNRAGTLTQRSMGIAEANGAADGQPVARMMEDKAIFQMTAATGAVDYEVNFDSISGTTLTFTSNVNAASDRVGYIALDLGGLSSAVGTYEPPTSTGAHTLSLGFTPGFCILGLNGCAAVDTAEQDGDAGVFGISLIDSVRQYCNSVAIEDLSATTDTQSLSDDQAIRLPAHDGASDLYAGTLTTLNDTGVVFNYSTAHATTRKWPYLAIEAPTAGFAATLGTGTNKATQTTVSATTDIAVGINQVVVVCVASDNEDTADGQTSLHSGVTIDGNAATKGGEFTNAQGAANAGATASGWYWRNTTGSSIASASTVVATHSVGKDAKAITALLFDIDSLLTLATDGIQTAADDAADPSSITATGAVNDLHLWVRIIAIESDTAGSITPTAGWTAFQGTGTTGGAETSNISVRGEWKISTGTSSGASNPTVSAKDSASVLIGIALTAVVPGSGTSNLTLLGVG
jgi:hypothetical protein